MKTRGRLAIVSLAIVAASIGLSSCNQVDRTKSDDEVPRIVDEEISIGVVVALTGHHAEPYGFPMQRGFELAREEINNLGEINLTFLIEDDRAHQMVRRLPCSAW